MTENKVAGKSFEVEVVGVEENHSEYTDKKTNVTMKENRLSLLCEYYDFINDEQEELGITLLKKDADDEEYTQSKVSTVFERLSELSDIDLEVPEETTFKSLEKALEELKDSTISVYRNDYGNYSIFENTNDNSNNYNFFEKAQSGANFIEKYNLEIGKKIVVPFKGFFLETHNKVFNKSGEASDVNYRGTETRDGLYNYYYDLLSKDDSSTAKKALKRLEEYKKKVKKMTTSGIIQSVGLFSSNSGDLDYGTIDSLVNSINTTDGNKSHICFASVRSVFSKKFYDEDRYKTSEMKARTWLSKNPEQWTVTFNLQDTVLQEFKNFTSPLSQLGLLTNEDVEYLKSHSTNGYAILGKIQEVLMRNHFVLELETSQYGKGSPFCKVLTLRPANEKEVESLFKDKEVEQKVKEIEEVIEEEEDDLPASIEEEIEVEVEEPKPKKEKKTTKKKKEEVEEVEDDFFEDDDEDDLW